jgi:hypothetical protein
MRYIAGIASYLNKGFRGKCVDIIGGITGVINLVVKAKALAHKTTNVELKKTIVDLQERLMEMNSQIVGLQEENEKLKASAATQSEVAIKDGVYYKRDGEGPFCTGCYDSKKLLSRLTELGASHRIMGKWKCPVCRAYLGNQ